MHRSLLCTLLSVSTLAPGAGVADHPGVQGAQRLFEAWLSGQIAYRGLPGVVVGVVHDQDLVWSRGFGYADLDNRVPMTPAAKFRMASHSKLFTATAIMQLREAGRLRLDDPASRYLPWFRIRPAEPGDPPITVEQLLTHSSGLPREAGPHWSTREFPLAEGVRSYVEQHEAALPPETRWKYSNLAYTLAGMIVEAISGETWAGYVRKHIFEPLGMNDSSVDQPVQGLAVGYGRRMPDGSRKRMPFVDARGLAAATGITSTVGDMARFVSLQFRKGPASGSQILSTGSLREMHRVRVLENNWQRGSAIGFAVNREKEKVYVGHGGSYFGYKTHTLIQLEDRVGVIVLTNGDDSIPADLALHLMQTVGDAVAKAAARPPADPEWDPSWSRFAGLYRGDFGDIHVVEMNQRLVTIDPSGREPETQNRLIPIGGGRFRLEAATGGVAVGEIVRFAEENGRVVRMYTGDTYADRVQP
jgi:CubicO group peptidase (beta-lactamase class C family)